MAGRRFTLCRRCPGGGGGGGGGVCRHICGGIDYTSDFGSLLPYYKSTLIPKIRVLIFNGDVDCCVPYKGNEWWTSSLGLKVEQPWRKFAGGMGSKSYQRLPVVLWTGHSRTR